MPTSTLDDTFTHFGGFFFSFMGSWLLNFIQDRHVASFDPFDIQNTLKLPIRHAQMSLFDDCAGGSQGVQLLDGSNKGQI